MGIGVTYKTAWLLAQKLRRSMGDPDRDLLEGVVEVDQTEIPFRAGDAFFEPGPPGAASRRQPPKMRARPHPRISSRRMHRRSEFRHNNHLIFG